MRICWICNVLKSVLGWGLCVFWEHFQRLRKMALATLSARVQNLALFLNWESENVIFVTFDMQTQAYNQPPQTTFLPSPTYYYSLLTQTSLLSPMSFSTHVAALHTIMAPLELLPHCGWRSEQQKGKPAESPSKVP